MDNPCALHQQIKFSGAVTGGETAVALVEGGGNSARFEWTVRKGEALPAFVRRCAESVYAAFPLRTAPIAAADGNRIVLWMSNAAWPVSVSILEATAPLQVVAGARE